MPANIITFKTCASKSSSFTKVVQKGVIKNAPINQKDILLKSVVSMGSYGYFVLNYVVGNDSNV